jgi:hypothetical protein
MIKNLRLSYNITIFSVWQRLEEQNPKFFKSYYTRLALKHQIEQFNKLLDKQKQLMDEEQTKVASLPSQNSNLGLQQGINRGMTISVPECSSFSPHMFGYDGKISEAGPNVDNASATPITNAKSTLHSVNESVMDYPYTYLNEPLSREFSLSDMPDYMFSGKSSLFCFYVLMCEFE